VAPDRTERKLAAILSADVVGYSRLMADDEAATVEAVKATWELCDGLIRQYGGRVVDAVGDNLLADFPSVVDAVACGVLAQQELGGRNAELTEQRRMLLRIGINLGDVLIDEDRIYGDGVNIAARVQALAEPGGVAISRAAFDQVEEKLELEFEDLGEHAVKNIPKPIRVYRVAVSEGREGPAARALPGFSGRPAIAVLPFDNLSADAEQDYFADGLAEDLITRLSQARGFSVIARASSFLYRGRGVDLAQVGRELGARYVVLGSVRRAGSRVRVSAQLAEARTGLDVWADRYDRELGEIFVAQDELTRAIVSAIEPRLQHVEQQRALRRDPSDIDAWDAVLRGTWHLFRQTRDDLAVAEALLRRATELDPLLVSAWANLANCLFLELYYGWASDSAARMDEAMQLARRAVAVDGADPTAQYALAWGYLFRGDHEAARVAGERAVELNPSLSGAHWALGVALTGLGRADDGAAAIQEAIRLSPRDPAMRFYLQNLGIAHLMACRYEEAAECARRSLALSLDQAAPHRLLAACHGHLGRVEEARGAIREAVRLEPDFSLEELRRINHPAIVEQLLDGWRKAGVDPARLSER
jgi:adenylate cyclase